MDRPDLAPGASCVIQVGFLPAAAGTWTGTLQVTDGLGFQHVRLQGTVVAGHVAPSPASLSFGNVRVGKQTKAATVTVTNDGSADLRIVTLSLLGPNAGDFAILSDSGTTCANATLQVQATCTVQLVFRPSAKGTRSASLSIASDDPAPPGCR